MGSASRDSGENEIKNFPSQRRREWLTKKHDATRWTTARALIGSLCRVVGKISNIESVV